MRKEMDEREVFLCPVGKFFIGLEKVTGKRSKFFHNLSQSRIEFLKGIRSLVDDRIEDLKKKADKK